MSELARRTHPRLARKATDSPTIPHRSRSGSVLAGAHGSTTAALLLSVALPGCLVTETRDIPPRNQPPLILSADATGSITTATDSVFLVSADPTPLPNQQRNVPLAIDVVDPDDTVLEYRVFVIAPLSSNVFDAGIPMLDGGTAPSGFERRLYSAQRFPLAPQNDRVTNRGTVSTILVPGEEFLPSGRCYAVEVRVSAAFRGAANDPFATDKHLPVRTDDLSSVLYWVASYGTGDTTVDLATCPVHTR